MLQTVTPLLVRELSKVMAEKRMVQTPADADNFRNRMRKETYKRRGITCTSKHSTAY